MVPSPPLSSTLSSQTIMSSPVTPSASPSTSPLTLTTLPPELLLTIFTYLEIPDLLQASRTCHALRTLACDPLLHHLRLHHASSTLSHLLQRRPSKSTLCPPTAWIWLSKTNVLSRQISKSLIRIRLAHNLEHRPSSAELVERAILPLECSAAYSSPVSPALIQSQQAITKRRLRDRLGRKLERRPSVGSLVDLNIIPAECVPHVAHKNGTMGNSGDTARSGDNSGGAGRRYYTYSVSVSPALIATRRKVIRESLKDGLRAWVEGRAIAAQKRKADEMDATERKTVKNLVKRFAGVSGPTTRKEGSPPGMGMGMGSGAAMGTGQETSKRRTSWGENQADFMYGACAQPTRARVLGLKRFWEGVIKGTGDVATARVNG